MSSEPSQPADKTLGPILSIAIVLALLAVTTTIALVVFWRSEAKHNIVLIQQLSQGDIDAKVPADFFQDGINDDNVLTVSELLQIRRNIEQEANKLVPAADFDGSELDQDKLGF